MLFVCFILRPCQHDNGYKTIGHRFKSTPMNGPRFRVPGLPWWSPIEVITEVDGTQLQFERLCIYRFMAQYKYCIVIIISERASIRRHCKPNTVSF